jgi:hypothetical protein
MGLDHSTESTGAPASGAPADHTDPTGLPWPHTWPGVYAFVLASFVTWVALLTVFELIFS